MFRVQGLSLKFRRAQQIYARRKDSLCIFKRVACDLDLSVHFLNKRNASEFFNARMRIPQSTYGFNMGNTSKDANMFRVQGLSLKFERAYQIGAQRNSSLCIFKRVACDLDLSVLFLHKRNTQECLSTHENALERVRILYGKYKHGCESVQSLGFEFKVRACITNRSSA